MDSVTKLLPFLEHSRHTGYYVVFLVTVLESLAGIGVFIPGSTLAVLAGSLAAQGYFSITVLIGVAAAGAIMGDCISFQLGRRKIGLAHLGKEILSPERLEKGETLFKRHGPKSIFVGRFIGVVRAIVPYVAGLSGMEPRRFYFWDVAGGFAWSAFHLSAGYFIGHAWSIFAVWLDRAGLLATGLLLLALCVFLFKRHADRSGISLAGMCQRTFHALAHYASGAPLIRNLRARYPGPASFCQDRVSPVVFSGLPLTVLAGSFLLIFLVLAVMVWLVFFSGSWMADIDLDVATVLVTCRGEKLSAFLLWVTLLGKAEVIVVGTLLAALLFAARNENEYLPPFLAVVAGSSLFCSLLKEYAQRPRPVNLAAVAETGFSFPSGHATVAVAFYGFLTYYLWRQNPDRRLRMRCLYGGIAIILAIGFSRLYFGVHFLSDIVSGYLLGLLWLLFGIWLVERRKYDKPTRASPIRLSRRAKRLSRIIVCIGLGLFIVRGWRYDPRSSETADSMPQRIAASDLHAAFAQLHLPFFVQSLSGGRRDPLNIAIAARDETHMTAMLVHAGWQPTDAIDASSIAGALYAMMSGTDYPRAPVTPRFWHERANSWGFRPTAAASTPDRHPVLRLWRTPLETPEHQQIFIGFISYEKADRWRLRHSIDPDVDAARTFFQEAVTISGVVADSSLLDFIRPTTLFGETREGYDGDGRLYFILAR